MSDKPQSDDWVDALVERQMDEYRAHLASLAVQPGTCPECGRSGFRWWQFTAGVCHGCYTRDRRKLKRHKQRDCVTCGLEFTTTRTDAKFCSNACRQKAHRRASAGLTP
jgi:predicted RNA-binding Zn-ribbon protein involved in translation (DUF1610 family)